MVAWLIAMMCICLYFRVVQDKEVTLEYLDLRWDYIFTQTIPEPTVRNFQNVGFVLFWYFRDFQVLKEESGLKESLVHRFPFYILIPWLLFTARSPVETERSWWEQAAAARIEFIQGFKFEQFSNNILT